MTSVNDMFKASAGGFGDTMTGRTGTVSFKLPQYQRPYDWGTPNVDRLLQDCLNGLQRAASKKAGDPYVFLGTIILTSDETKEPNFSGESLVVVDGQQRITTLLLLSCALFATLRSHLEDITSVANDTARKWLEQETNEQMERLYRCAIGQTQGLTATTPFPRMVRFNDRRGHQQDHANYHSAVAVFLDEFGGYCRNKDGEFYPVKNDANTYLLGVYQHITARIEQFVYLGQSATEEQDDEFDPPVVSTTDIAAVDSRELFAKLGDTVPQDELDGVIAHVANWSGPEGLMRLCLFASYLMHSVVLTVVEALSEGVAFRIFDALNTTGEPLTALETLKPNIIQFEDQLGNGYAGSESETWWGVLEENVIDPSFTPARRQQETKELVTGFALFYKGEKLGSDLRDQRDNLMAYFARAEQDCPSVARNIIRDLGRLAQFRSQFWEKEGINGLVGPESQLDDYLLLKLCLRFIADSNTSTVIPILTRYWIEFDEMDSERHFLQAVKAVTAFLVLRRAMTRGTAGIDSDFRRMMSNGAGAAGNPLCLGTDMTNQILGIDDLKSGLRALLASNPLKVADKQTWLNRAREIPLGYRGSQAICRFLLFAASHDALPDADHPGLLKAGGLVSSGERRLLTYETWVAQRYATIEHVAPSSETINGWDPSIYRDLETRHGIGNLVLLPERENKSIGNAPWEKKQLFYRALVAENEEDRENAIVLAQEQGLMFGNKTLKLIKAQERLFMLDPVAAVEDWTIDLITKRTDNVLSLAWDRIAPWLFN